jgi:hypothetical protein
MWLSMHEIDTLLEAVPDKRTLREMLAQTLQRAEVLRALIKVADKKSERGDGPVKHQRGARHE